MILLALATAFCSHAALLSPDTSARWWPTQALPKALVLTAPESSFGSLGLRVLAQSISGLAAKAVNDGKSDEMVWVGTDKPDVAEWLKEFRHDHLRIEIGKTYGLWDLVDRYRKSEIVKGYILYRDDASGGDTNDHRGGMDCSVNVATSLAALFGGILIDEQLEPTAKQHGLKMLLDARDKTQDWCFAHYQDSFTRRMLCCQDPRKSNTRDFAIAQGALTVYGADSFLPKVMEWLTPTAPILGWNGGDEYQSTELSTRWGHIQTATDWCDNLPVLMAGSEGVSEPKVKPFDPKKIDWSDRRSTVSFIDTDGDNTQWLEQSFFMNRSYWANPDRGKIPFGWSTCFAHLSQLCPQAIQYAVQTAAPNDSFIEWGGGYYYPDLFGSNRPDRWAVLAKHARNTWETMKRNGTRMIGFNVTSESSPDAQHAYQTFAAQTDGLLAILVFQYNPYEAGAGRIFWVKDRLGVEIPVISARYSIWNHENGRDRSGTPAKVARDIRSTVAQDPGMPHNDWVIAHVWSYFRKAPGSDENAEDMSQDDAEAHGGERGYSPCEWCAARLPSSIRVVSPEEMIWRIRMQHDPTQTRGSIAAFIR